MLSTTSEHRRATPTVMETPPAPTETSTAKLRVLLRLTRTAMETPRQHTATVMVIPSAPHPPTPTRTEIQLLSIAIAMETRQERLKATRTVTATPRQPTLTATAEILALQKPIQTLTETQGPRTETATVSPLALHPAILTPTETLQPDSAVTTRTPASGHGNIVGLSLRKNSRIQKSRVTSFISTQKEKSMKKRMILMALTALMAVGANAQDKNEDIRSEACNDCCALQSISLPYNPRK